MSKHVSVGIVGTSWWADFMHLPALKSHAHANLVAICGRNRDRAEAMAAKYDIPHVFTDYQEMIEQGGLEALVVATPDELHYPITMAALNARLHVLCEKPMARTLAQAQEMYQKAEAVGVKHMTYFAWRWLPPLQYVHRLIGEGYLGQCYYSEFRYVGGYGREATYGWKWDRQRGSGILGDLGVHMIDMAHWLIGDVVKVNAHLSAFIERPGVDGQPLDPTNDAAVLTLKYKDGGQGVIHVSGVAHVGQRDQKFQMVLYGADGTLELSFSFDDGYVVRGARSDEAHIHVLTIPADIFNGVNPESSVGEQFEQLFTKQSVGSRLFIDSIVQDRPVAPNFYDGLRAQKVIEAAIAADVHERWMTVQ